MNRTALLAALVPCAAVAGGLAQSGPPAQPIAGHVLAAYLAFPFLFGIFVAIGCTALIKAINRDILKRRPLSRGTQLSWGLAMGAFWGPFFQWGLQDTLSTITGAPLMPRLIIVNLITSPFASVAFYTYVLMPYLKDSRPRIYEMLRVRHRDPETGRADDGDLTMMQARDDQDDRTVPKGHG